MHYLIEFQNICESDVIILCNVPKLIIIGNIAYDIVDFSKVNKTRESIINKGGACLFSSIPASIFQRVGMVAKIGNDFDYSKLFDYDIDLTGVKRIDKPTTKFYTVWNTIDGQSRNVYGEVKPEMEVGATDIPHDFLKANHFHITTANPIKQLEIIKFLRNNTTATISVDTIDDYAFQNTCKQVFDLVDIAFIDKEYKNLIDCEAKVKIIKNGKEGCTYLSKNAQFSIFANVVTDVVDKTGAGDCLNGVFLSLLTNGVNEKEALKIAVDIATESIKKQGIMNLEIKKIKRKYQNLAFSLEND